MYTNLLFNRQIHAHKKGYNKTLYIIIYKNDKKQKKCLFTIRCCIHKFARSLALYACVDNPNNKFMDDLFQ